MDRASTSRAVGPRHSILDLAPLELECLSVLWPMGEGTVREIHRALAMSRPRAYTTVMTIMDRLDQKGIVVRRKVGRAFRYQARLSAEEARLKAVEKIVEGFFDGSSEALAAHLSSRAPQRISPRDFRPAAPAAVAAFATPVVLDDPAAPAPIDAPGAPVAELPNRNLDERLL
jgi:predicted transcriptional regulator